MDYRNVRSSDALLSEMLSVTKGGREVPVIVEAGRVQIGYGGT